MVIVQLLGGMGNQMFQYSLGRVLSIKNKTELVVDTSILRDHRPGVHAVNRNYDLDLFKLEVREATSSERWKYNRHGFGTPGKILSKSYELIFGNKINYEKHFHFDPSVTALKGDIYIAGLWQSYLYFEGYENVIREDFALKSDLTGIALDLGNEIMTKPSVCLNVRRGDYVNVNQTRESLGFIGLDYYQRALSLMEEKKGPLHYYVFSDEIDWCRSNLNLRGSNVTFVDHKYAGSRFSYYLELMRRCRYFIIPNSTFAWWAAWLSESKDKVVISPLRWFALDTNDTKDLIPAGWIRI